MASLAVIGLVYLPDRKSILMGLRVKDGLWGMPGGKVESGETALRALARELREETGLQLLGAFPVTFRQFRLSNGSPYTSLYYLCHTEGLPRNCEPSKCSGWEWCNIYHLPEPLWGPHLKAIALAGSLGHHVGFQTDFDGLPLQGELHR